MPWEKIITKEEFKKIKYSLKESQKVIVLCHGVFDLVHPGHIIHFEQAKQMGDVLVVSVTASKYVRKGPGRPYFSDEMRMRFLSAIEYIDYIILSEGYTGKDIIEAVEPDIYVKGAEYSNPQDDITGKISEEQSLVEKHGGKVCYTNGAVFSSTKLINNAMSGLPEEVREYMEDFNTRHSMDEIQRYAAMTEKLKILVIGDVIIDKYTYCSVHGLMSKDMGYSARQKFSEEYLGGAIAFVRHLASFSDNVTLISIIGNEDAMRLRLFDELSGLAQLKLFYSDVLPTIVKHRYLTKQQKRDEYKKVFSICNLPIKKSYESGIKEKFKSLITKEVGGYDVVFLSDFGHGLIDREIINIVQKKAKFLVLNCQTNSLNYGLNLITKYTRADAYALDQTELRLAVPQYANDEMEALKELSKHLGGSSGWLTRGSWGAYGIEKGVIQDVPAFTLNVKDTVGAGDAFLSMAGLFAAVGAPMEVGTFLGNIGGALGANIVGNKESLEKVNVLKFASTLMNI